MVDVGVKAELKNEDPPVALLALSVAHFHLALGLITVYTRIWHCRRRWFGAAVISYNPIYFFFDIIVDKDAVWYNLLVARHGSLNRAFHQGVPNSRSNSL